MILIYLFLGTRRVLASPAGLSRLLCGESASAFEVKRLLLLFQSYLWVILLVFTPGVLLLRCLLAQSIRRNILFAAPSKLILLRILTIPYRVTLFGLLLWWD